MIAKPIKYQALRSLEEVKEFSLELHVKKPFGNKLYARKDEFFEFVDGDENESVVYITPFRPEIRQILKKSGFEETGWNDELDFYEMRESYRLVWLSKMAEEACWEKTFEMAHKLIQEEGKVKSICGSFEICRVKDVTTQDFQTGRYYFKGMVKKLMEGYSSKNLCTFILVDDKTVYLCDEYGRSILIQMKKTANDFVNALIDAGYTRTTHPECYVMEMVPKKDTQSGKDDFWFSS